jgi:hypothetical protein
MKQKHTDIIFMTVGILFFFFNGYLLPHGLLYTILLTPFFLLNLLQKKEAKVYLGFFLVTLLLGIIQYTYTGHLGEYLKSFILMQTAAIFVINAYAVINGNADIPRLFKALGSMNLVLLVLSIIFLFIPAIRSVVWYEVPISNGIPVFPRLKMFTYEASYFSLLIVPVFCFYFLRKVLLNGNWGLALAGFTLSLILSFSMGVLGGLIISILLLYAFNLNDLKQKINLSYVAIGCTSLIVAGVIALKFFPHNPLFARLSNIESGQDTSARGRTYESFELAWNLAKMQNKWLGIGLGQLKIFGREYIIQYYSYSNMIDDVRIPNAVAETLNVYGITGIVIRFSVILFLFIRTKVWQNYYRLLLFIFIFIYQFTGSFLFNIVEYIIWVLAFSPALFQQFNRQHFIKTQVR